jgi:hypothetical protein
LNDSIFRKISREFAEKEGGVKCQIDRRTLSHATERATLAASLHKRIQDDFSHRWIDSMLADASLARGFDVVDIVIAATRDMQSSRT